MTQRIAGIAYLKAGGKQYPLRGNFTVSPSEYERAMLAGQDYVHGYSDVPRVPFIEGDVSLLPNINIKQLGNMRDVKVQADLANGKVYVLTEAVCTAALELNARDGLTRVRWEGVTCEEFPGSTLTLPGTATAQPQSAEPATPIA